MKLYLIVRRDLDFGQQAVQMVHAMREFVALYPEEDLAWYRTSNTLALLSTKNESTLHELLTKAQLHGVPAAPFREPDLNDELTAIALGPSGKRLCRGLPLALGSGVLCAAFKCTETTAANTLETQP